MRTSSVFVLLATLLAQQALAVPTPFQDSLERRVNGQADWGTVPDDKKFQVTGKMEPVPGQSGTHITYRKGNDPSKVTNYQAWKPNTNGRPGMGDAGRWRGEGKAHGGVPPPIYYPAEPGAKKQQARPARPNEAPVPKKGSKDDISVGTKPKPNHGAQPKPKDTSPLKPLPANAGKPKGGRSGSKTVRELGVEERDIEFEARDIEEELEDLM